MPLTPQPRDCLSVGPAAGDVDRSRRSPRATAPGSPRDGVGLSGPIRLLTGILVVVSATVVAGCSSPEKSGARSPDGTTGNGADTARTETTLAGAGAPEAVLHEDATKQLVHGVVVATPYRLLRINEETDTEECETKAIKVGTPVLVKDEGGVVVGSSQVEKGEAKPDVPGAIEDPYKCNLSWTVRVGEADVYNFEVGNAKATFRRSELADRNYSIRIEAPG